MRPGASAPMRASRRLPAAHDLREAARVQPDTDGRPSGQRRQRQEADIDLANVELRMEPPVVDQHDLDAPDPLVDQVGDRAGQPDDERRGLQDHPGDRVHPDLADQQPAAPSGVPRRQDQYLPPAAGDADPMGGRRYLAVCGRLRRDRSSLAGGRLARIGAEAPGRIEALVPLGLITFADHKCQDQAPDWGKSDLHPGLPLSATINLGTRQMRFLPPFPL